MRLLDEKDALTEIRSLLADTARAKLAVAFWGEGATERLGLDQVETVEILCNLDSGACNPKELRRLRALPGVTLKSHPALHAKVYWTPQAVVLGSSNASANGLALEGDAANAWCEANVRLDTPSVLTDVEAWFASLFAAGYPVDEEDLDRAEVIWKARTRMAPTGRRLVKTVLAAFAAAPAHPVWKRVKLAFWKDDLDTEEEGWLGEQRTTLEVPRAEWVSAYSHWNDEIQPNDWVLDFDLSGETPCYNYIWKVLPADVHPNRRLVYKVDRLDLEGLGQFVVGKDEIATLLSLSSAILERHGDKERRNAVVDLPTAMAARQIDTRKLSERAFHRAMKAIYDEAATFDYRPMTFLRMLSDHGGVETARRLIRGPTSGFTKLWEHRRLDLSVEALILKPEWHSLFTDEERKLARARLREYGYTPEE